MPELFPFTPNWDDTVNVDVTYKTEILTSRGLREQRLAHRGQPRKAVSFATVATRSRLVEFMALAATRLQAEFILEEPTRAVRTVSAAPAGAFSLEIDAAPPAWVTLGGYIVFETENGRVFRAVSGVVGSVISFELPLDAAVEGGVKVHPGLIGRLGQTVSGELLTNTVGGFTVDFLADPGLNVYEAPTEAAQVFNGRELFLLKPNWATAPSVSVDGLLETLDYDRGRVSHNVFVNMNNLSVRYEFLNRNSNAAEALTAFFHRMKGQQGEFYAPTWQNDLDLSVGALAGSSALVVQGTGTFTLFSASTIYRAAIVFFRDGTFQANRITGIVQEGANSRLTFANPWGRDINTETVLMTCWLPVWRLAIDTLALEWVTRTVCQTQVTMKALEDLA